jgi:transcriptional regulator with XRE-family HTH domain
VTRTVREGFAERFKLALDEAGYGNSQLKELGTLFAVTPQAVRKWLLGEAMPTAEHAPLLAQKLGVRRAWLLDNELPMRAQVLDMAEKGSPYASSDESLSISREEFKLLTDYRSLPRNLRVLVEQLAEAMKKEFRRRAGEPDQD